MKVLMAAFAALIMVALTAGCAGLAERETASQLAVKYAALKVIDDNPAKAERVSAIAGEARALLSGETAGSVGELEGYVRGRIDWAALDTADRLLVDTLIAELAAELRERLGDGLLSPENRLRVDRVLGWIMEAAALIRAAPS